ncbi:MAG TPA: MMPL family transporter [Solirubrobacterales bacterium]|nr:MMPL family transporter [Solirubrobacterales bacterium]
MRRPRRRTLAALAVPIALLALLGLGLDGRLSPSSLNIPGTEASRGNALLEAHFGPTAPFPILLQGPPGALDRQGPRLVRALRAESGVTTLSPWDRGDVSRLRPSPRSALVIADFHTGIDAAVKHTVPELNRLLEENVRAPVRSTQTGYATISRAIQQESISSAERAELIALPILLVVLLLVFRSPVAAAVPLGFGAVTVLASRGLLWIVTHFASVDALALTVCTMMGLALGVDYALLMVSRFREELAGGASPRRAALRTRRTAGRTTAFAGSTLVLSMLVALFVVPGALLASLAATLILVVALSVAVAFLAVPPLLVLLGPNVDRWRLGGAAVDGESSLLMRFVNGALARPAPVAIAIGAVVLLLAAPALALKTGPLSPGQLPGDDPVREDYELITHVAGSGFEAPFQVVVAAERGTMTEPQRLAALERWQWRIASLPGVETVVGPAQIRHAVTPLHRAERAVLDPPSSGGSPFASLSKLGRGLGRASAGVATLRAGLSEATYGASRLSEGGGQASAGAGLLARGLARAEAGAVKALGSLESFSGRAPRLVKAQFTAANGANLLHAGIASLIPNLRRSAVPQGRELQKSLNGKAHEIVPGLKARAGAGEEHLAATLARLEAMTVGKGDPEYEAALAEAREGAAALGGEAGASLSGELAALQTGLVDDARLSQQVTFWLTSTISSLERLAKGSLKLREGLIRLARGAKRIQSVLSDQVERAQVLRTGLPQLTAGAARLAAGTAKIASVAARLRDGLGGGYHRSYPLQTGLRGATVRVTSTNRRLRHGRVRLLRSSPHIFDSGYVVLSALDGSPPRARQAAGSVVDLEHGGQAATMLVFSRYDLNSPGSIALNRTLAGDARSIGRATDATAAVAGGPATLNTYSRVARDRIPFVVAAICLATFLVLVLILRALPLAALAVALNLATVGVAFGVLTALTYVPSGWPLGGHGYIDAIGATLIFGVVFGLSIDYAVFLLVRMREHREAGGTHADSISFGLEKTARVITGAAAIMMAVFVAFGGSSIATVSQLGVGLTIAVLLDATVVRIVLLPALMLLIGERVWWLPKPLARVMPRIDI